MPEFHARQGEQDAWKAAVLNGEIELTEIDTDPFNYTRGREPTLPSTREARDMIAGGAGRPGSEVVNS